MILYVLKRLLQSIVTILLVVTIVFLLLRLLPTDYYFTEDELMKLTEEQKHDRLEAAGFLDPPLTQLGRFFKQLFTEFDLGTSRRIQANQPVVTVIGSKFGVSMRLGLISLGISLVLGVCFGVLQARYKDGIFDHIGTAYTVFVNAVPSLVTYSLVLAFGARCPWITIHVQYAKTRAIRYSTDSLPFHRLHCWLHAVDPSVHGG